MRLKAAWAGYSKNLSFVYQNYKMSADTSECTGVSRAGRCPEPYDGKMERFHFLAKKLNSISIVHTRPGSSYIHKYMHISS